MPKNDDEKCDVCNINSCDGVHASSVLAVSYGLCKECIAQNAEMLDVLLFLLDMTDGMTRKHRNSFYGGKYIGWETVVKLWKEGVKNVKNPYWSVLVSMYGDPSSRDTPRSTPCHTRSCLERRRIR